MEALNKGEEPPFLYSLANAIVLKKVQAALGLEKCEVNCYGAAPLKKSTRDFFCELDMPLLNLYGMTETSGGATFSNIIKFKLDTCGFPLPGTEMKIHNPDENGEGEVCMRGRSNMMGYYKNEKASLEAIDSDGFIHSGDRGKLDSDNYLKITGRIKELIITAGGENIAPVPIEDNFKEEFPPCANIMVLGDD